ncbi:hypothetical protein IVB30_10230 [Bradyrhizobium sp. 200]|nr:hypothetical protein [Bradyrhizobium sp. 200]UPJ51685.1 hypothetical protein IVB30_10230 [Bradyrhizobium sp. 200]
MAVQTVSTVRAAQGIDFSIGAESICALLTDNPDQVGELLGRPALKS